MWYLVYYVNSKSAMLGSELTAKALERIVKEVLSEPTVIGTVVSTPQPARPDGLFDRALHFPFGGADHALANAQKLDEILSYMKSKGLEVTTLQSHA